MTAIAGAVGDLEPVRRRSICDNLLRSLHPYGSDGSASTELGSAAFGRALRLGLAEDEFDRQPLTDGRWLFVTDCRLNNPDELADRLGIAKQERYRLADPAILFLAWQRWGEAGLDTIEGDFAFASWDAQLPSLTMVRSILSSKPLFFASIENGIAFASMPLALFQLPEVDRRFDLSMFARMVANSIGESGQTIYRGVSRVEPGNIVSWDGSLVVRRFSELTPVKPQAMKLGGVADEFEHLLCDAVRNRLRRHHGIIASELSSGRDSSAVTALAARILAQNGEELVALTHAPSAGRDHPVWPGRVADESVVAAKTAGIYPNIRHRVVRHNGTFTPATLRDCERAAQYPIGHPCNLAWEQALMRVGAEQGATVLLTGAWGNLTISAGGGVAMGNLLRQHGLAAWLRELRKGDALRPERTSFILNTLATALLPRTLLKPLRHAAERLRGGLNTRARWLKPAFSGEAAAAAAATARRAHQDYQTARGEILQTVDQGGGFAIAYAGMEERDPTADRRLAEFCLGLDPLHLVDMPNGRPLYDQIMAGKVAPEVIRQPVRGAQGADWYELFRVDDLRSWFETFCHEPEFVELVDIAEVERALNTFPTEGWGDPAIYQRYRVELLTVLEVGSFIHFIRSEVRP
jgi:asparagine synthase (glutamine-hydrolysing)